jgi:uncharacterized phage-associated protein
MARVDDVAAALLSRTGPITAMKLQKLVYYVQAWHVAEFGEPAFEEPIEAWKDGPVIRRLFEQHRGVRRITAWSSGDGSELPPSIWRIVVHVAQAYGRCTAEELSAVAHRERPWRRARGNLLPEAASTAVINLEDMAMCYRRQGGGSGERMVRYSIASARLEGASDPTNDEVDVLLAVAEGRVPVEDAVAQALAAYR